MKNIVSSEFQTTPLIPKQPPNTYGPLIFGGQNAVVE